MRDISKSIELYPKSFQKTWNIASAGTQIRFRRRTYQGEFYYQTHYFIIVKTYQRERGRE